MSSGLRAIGHDPMPAWKATTSSTRSSPLGLGLDKSLGGQQWGRCSSTLKFYLIGKVSCLGSNEIICMRGYLGTKGVLGWDARARGRAPQWCPDGRARHPGGAPPNPPLRGLLCAKAQVAKVRRAYRAGKLFPLSQPRRLLGVSLSLVNG